MTLPVSTPDIASAADPRWAAVSAPHGTAALRFTHWLDAEPREYEGAPGLWRGEDGRVVGAGLPGETAEVALSAGEHLDIGPLRLKAINRGGAPALRVFDPETPGRTSLRGILSFPQDDAWAIPGVFHAAAEGQSIVIESVDGYEREEPAVGTISLDVGGERVELTVWGDLDDELEAVIADGTSNVDAYRFRFLPIEVPAADGSVTVDFNRAYLPPCAFSDHYVCPLPPLNNRLTARVEAGERIADRA
ncbi:DUF1684 domain-containing protein [Microbacterium jejuense]|uniref:DUF1684 domain-containing protein n=1 Tax=Microbacterium jejuense TaxID=1263637 RepID=UPI0031EAE744